VIQVLLFLKKPTPRSNPLLNPKPNPKPFFFFFGCDCCKKFDHKFIQGLFEPKNPQIFLNNNFFSKYQIYVHGSSASYKYVYIRMFNTFFFSAYGWMITTLLHLHHKIEKTSTSYLKGSIMKT
jgi:hypothetical protein